MNSFHFYPLVLVLILIVYTHVVDSLFGFRGFNSNHQNSKNSDNNNHRIILCLGDSITNGTGASDLKTTSYPSILQLYFNQYSKLKSKIVQKMSKYDENSYGLSLSSSSNYEVINLGVSGASVSRTTNKTYWITNQFKEAMSYDPSIVIIGFGTNDAKTYAWNESAYRNDYIEFIELFQSKPSHPQIYLIVPPPCYEDLRFNIQQNIVNKKIPKIIQSIAEKLRVETINVFDVLGGVKLKNKKAFYTLDDLSRKGNDGIHPNDLGYYEMAFTVASAIMGNDVARDIKAKLHELHPHLKNNIRKIV